MTDSMYGPITDPLNAVFGENVFQFWHTGGGCTAVQAFLESDITVLITDNPHLDYGEEAEITSMFDRVGGGGDHLYGYCVGVYFDEGCDLKAMDFCATVEELPGLVTQLIAQAIRGDR